MPATNNLSAKTIERLENVIRVLENVRKEKRKFDLSHWAGEDYNEVNEPCGTSACAIGYCALDPYLFSSQEYINALYSSSDKRK